MAKQNNMKFKTEEDLKKWYSENYMCKIDDIIIDEEGVISHKRKGYSIKGNNIRENTRDNTEDRAVKESTEESGTGMCVMTLCIVIALGIVFYLLG